MHDNIIISYEVDLRGKTLKLITYNKQKDNNQTLFTEGVLTHLFEDVLANSIILSVDEQTIEMFLKENSDELAQKEGECWPIFYDGLNELKDYLVNNNYKYIKIYASYGLCGWILAKNYFIK